MSERFKGPYGGFSGLAIALMIVAAGVFILVWPLVFIWALNTLFGQNIPLDFWTWLAAIMIFVTIAVSAKISTIPSVR